MLGSKLVKLLKMTADCVVRVYGGLTFNGRMSIILGLHCEEIQINRNQFSMIHRKNPGQFHFRKDF